MNRSDTKIQHGTYELRLDLTPVLEGILHAACRRDEKAALHDLVRTLSGYGVELTRILSASMSEVVKQAPKLFQKRVEEHRAAMRTQKLFGFKLAKEIEDECVSLALAETRALIEEVSLAENPAVLEMLREHRQVLDRLADAMVGLALEPNPDAKLDLKALKEFMEG